MSIEHTVWSLDEKKPLVSAELKDEKELEEDLNKIEEYREKKKEDEEIKNIKKKTKKKKDTDEKLDILDLYYKDKKENVDPIKRRLKWVKKEKTDEKKEKIDETQTTEDKKPKNVKATRNVSAIEKPQENITEADIKEELKQIFKQRGQNKYSLDNVERLEFLYTKTQNKLTQIEILSESTLQCFDNYSNQLSAFTSELWNKIYQDILEKYQGASEIENNVMVEYEKIASEIKEIQRRQDGLNKKTLKYFEKRKDLFENLDEDEENLKKDFDEIEAEIRINESEIKDNFS